MDMISARPPEISLLGGFSVSVQGAPTPVSLAAQRLVAFLALNGRRLTRGFVAGNLWLDKCEERAAANLRSALWKLRQLDPPLVTVTRTHVELASVLVDLHDAQRLIQRLLDEVTNLTEADLEPAILSLDLLPDWYDDWVVVERERLKQLRLFALERQCAELSARGAYGRAVAAGLCAVSAEPLRESAHRALISAHLAGGNWNDALAQYRTYASLLHDQLGLWPSDAMTTLIADFVNVREPSGHGDHAVLNRLKATSEPQGAPSAVPSSV
jgi:DNA-binding SARP family transcriptional activator